MAKEVISVPVATDTHPPSFGRWDAGHGKRSTKVVLPDMFTSFLAQEANVHPDSEQALRDSEAWVADACYFTEEQRRRLTKTKSSYFAAIAVWTATPERLRTACDWGNWILPFDDAFDSGDLKDAPETAQKEMDKLLDVMRDPNSYDFTKAQNGLIECHNDIWLRIVKDSTKRVQTRYAQGMLDYCKGALLQVYRASESIVPDVEACLGARKSSAAMFAFFPLMEYGLGLELSDEVFDNTAIRRLHGIGTQLAILHNDMLSYPREQAEGVNHNIIASHRACGYPAQQAYDLAGDRMRDLQRAWYLTCADVPSWGEQIDRQVQRYIRGMQDIVAGNLNWSFKTERYFGELRNEVRKNRVTHVMPLKGGSED